MACLVVDSKCGHLHRHRHDVHGAVHEAGLKLLVQIHKLFPSKESRAGEISGITRSKAFPHPPPPTLKLIGIMHKLSWATALCFHSTLLQAQLVGMAELEGLGGTAGGRLSNPSC